jgi:hypothetical protein
MMNPIATAPNLPRLIGLLTVAISLYAQEPVSNRAHPPRPGSINYVEGKASIGAVSLGPNSPGTVELDRDQKLETLAGKVEMLLAPGILLRLADNSALIMTSPELANVQVQLEKGRAMVEAINLQKEHRIRIGMGSASILLLKKGLYDFDAEHGEFRVLDGSAEVSSGGKTAKLGRNRMVVLSGELKATKFDERRYEDDFYRWSGLRSGYLSEASVDAARSYISRGPGWYGPGWTGLGWYWNPWFGSYTFLPPDGIYWGPFGWGFYSPIYIYRSPLIFYGNAPHRFGDYHYPYGHGVPRGGTPRRPRR